MNTLALTRSAGFTGFAFSSSVVGGRGEGVRKKERIGVDMGENTTTSHCAGPGYLYPGLLALMVKESPETGVRSGQ